MAALDARDAEVDRLRAEIATIKASDVYQLGVMELVQQQAVPCPTCGCVTVSRNDKAWCAACDKDAP